MRKILSRFTKLWTTSPPEQVRRESPAISDDSSGYDPKDTSDSRPDKIQITRVAGSSERNTDFYQLFPDIPESERLIEGEMNGFAPRARRANEKGRL
ncbi:unnamed protein product [Rhizoctonia solani]|uniref:Uncharacterized protein n=1 Tax=Rhizoctonia solani TaxID=456999 RepID=A0A8H3BFA4_9AGAM|nr:unnamed protein product [Rhizoctonia solani]